MVHRYPIVTLTLALAMIPVGAADLQIRLDPPVAGAVVSVGASCRTTTDDVGRAVCSGLSAGRHDAEIRMPDGQRYLRPVEIDRQLGGLTRLQFVEFVVRSNVPGVGILVDGRAVSPMGSNRTEARVWLEPGSHELVFAKPGFDSETRRLEVRRDPDFPTQRLSIALREGVPPKPTDRLQAVVAELGIERIVFWSLIGVLALAAIAIFVVLAKLVGRRGQRSRRFARFVVEDPIGAGGMATVYSAHDTLRRKGPPIALKIMAEHLLHDADLVHKFLREGEIVQNLNRIDPDAPIVEVYEYGRAGGDTGRPFIAMELLQGDSVLKLLQRQSRIDEAQAVHIATGVARALIPAHATGVYHRDLSPENVIVTENPRGGFGIRLIDFGVARHEYTSHGTLDGSITGKPPYMSPEQCRGGEVDHRTDIYALGVLLFAMLTGAPPFTGQNPLLVMEMHQSAPVTFPKSIGGSVRTILESALQKNRDRRIQTMAQFYQHLRAVQA